MDFTSIQVLQRLKHGAVIQQPIGDMEPEVRINVDQVRVERGVMDFRQWYWLCSLDYGFDKKSRTALL